MQTAERVIAKLRAHEAELRQAGLRSLSLFGSGRPRRTATLTLARNLADIRSCRFYRSRSGASLPRLRRPTVEFLIAISLVVTIVVAVFPVTIVTVMFTVFVPFSFFAAIPTTIVPLITVMLVPFTVVSARYGNGELLR
jgi:uncharacterized membrane protein